MNAAEIIDLLGLVPHPEGGWFTETWRSPPAAGDDRSAGTSIYFLLVAGERSHWHRVDAAETWHHYDGAPLELWMASDEETRPEVHVLGTDLVAGARPQIMVPPGVWQAAWSSGDWTLVGCTVVPGFEFAGFELAPPDWEPGHGQKPPPA